VPWEHELNIVVLCHKVLYVNFIIEFVLIFNACVRDNDSLEGIVVVLEISDDLINSISGLVGILLNVETMSR
jgi:hypothetical protein